MSYDRSWRTERPRPRSLPGGPDAGRWLRPADDYGPGYAMDDAGFWSRGVGTYRQWGGPSSLPGYDRGYGGPRRGGYDRGYGRDFRRGGYDRGGWAGPPRGWRHAEQLLPRPPVREPFVPAEAYRRHPEMDRAPRAHGAGWASGGDGSLSDTELERAVRRKLREDGWLDPRRIRVSAADGVVTLTGEVGDFMEARYAWDDAWETEGVRGVLNHVTVRPADGELHGDPFPQAEEVQARDARADEARADASA